MVLAHSLNEMREVLSELKQLDQLIKSWANRATPLPILHD